ncbi:hypothetical protein VUR80DRAFT_8624 [Thermomyces stellatus]
MTMPGVVSRPTGEPSKPSRPTDASKERTKCQCGLDKIRIPPIPAIARAGSVTTQLLWAVEALSTRDAHRTTRARRTCRRLDEIPTRSAYPLQCTNSPPGAPCVSHSGLGVLGSTSSWGCSRGLLTCRPAPEIRRYRFVRPQAFTQTLLLDSTTLGADTVFLNPYATPSPSFGLINPCLTARYIPLGEQVKAQDGRGGERGPHGTFRPQGATRLRPRHGVALNEATPEAKSIQRWKNASDVMYSYFLVTGASDRNRIWPTSLVYTTYLGFRDRHRTWRR